MIHYKLQLPPEQSALLTTHGTHNAEFLTPSRHKITANVHLSLSLKPSVPTTDTSRDGRRGLRLLHNESCDVERDRKEGREKERKPLKFLMRSLVFSLLNLYTSCLQAGWSHQHTTLHRQAATPGTATQLGVPSQPACSQSLFFIFVWQHEGLLHSLYLTHFLLS